MKRIYHDSRSWEITRCNNYIRRSKRICVLLSGSYNDFDVTKEVVVEYDGKFYLSSSFSIRNSLSGRVELNITGLVEITRDYKINLILE